MKVNKNNINNEDSQLALDLLNKLRYGNRVFGKPAEGLKKTLNKLSENAPIKDSADNIEYNLKDYSYESKIAKLKKGIKGEEILGEYFEKVIKLDNKLNDMIIFASLGDEVSNKDYIPDTDFLCLYGNNILVVDAKNINTKSDIPLFVDGKGIYTAINHDEPIIEVNSSVPYWTKTLKNEYKGNIDSIHGCVCIINKTGCEIFKNEDWAKSEIKPLHISELVDFLHLWISDKKPYYDLNLLISIAKKQIHKSENNFDLSYAKRLFKV